MSVDLVVQRGAGDRPGADIVEPLICSQAAALNRGRNELDSKAEPLQPVTYQIVFRAGLRLGQLVEVEDTFQGVLVRGKVVGISHDIGSGAAVTQLEVEKVQDF